MGNNVAVMESVQVYEETPDQVKEHQVGLPDLSFQGICCPRCGFRDLGLLDRIFFILGF